MNKNMRSLNALQKKAAIGAAKSSKRTLDDKSSKKNRTLSLDDSGYMSLAKYCAGHDLTVSEVVDELISAFLNEVAEN